ncbi:imm11 family protein [Burkholderia sp. Ac-20379]|uniref:imm11 family protein n=1 Tax=Burkholderia sp. Ac-20379 TaxID=2703900 RepID=UPI00197FA605|nr:DUF1629 domain-containing protein [Burkholderia sp. Ac-20379]MBN3724989.1 hypothetical protein [Burkholderia sp. Ac-20379]
MNRIYSLRQDDAFQALVQIDGNGDIPYDTSVAIRATARCGQTFGADYEPVRLSWGAPRRRKNGDIHTLLSPFLVLSMRAFDALSLLLQGSGEVLPVDAPVAGMAGFHITRVLEDAVDMQKSAFKVYPQATVFNRIVLLERAVRDADIFRLRERPATVFVSDKFKDAVEANALKGFDFGEEVPLSSASN